jgi:hypothetical protein
MKTISFLSLTSLAGLVAFAGGLTLNLGALPLFAVSAVTLLSLQWAGDYRARRDYAAGTTIALQRRQPLPLAA